MSSRSIADTSFTGEVARAVDFDYPMHYAIRSLTRKDEPIIWEMLRHAAHEPSVKSVQGQPCLARYAIAWGRDGDMGCAAEAGGTPIGAAWLRLWSGEDRGFGFVSHEIPELGIAVLPQYRGRGVGSRLLSEVLRAAKGRFPAVSLSVRADNRAVRLYERLGFVGLPETEAVNRTGGASFNMVYEFE